MFPSMTPVQIYQGQDKSESIYPALDIFVLASYSETYGLVTIEAMASGLPIVATNAGGTAEIIANQETGLLFKPKNSDELADKLLKLIDNRGLAEEIAQKAQLDAVKRFSHKTQAERWAELIRKEML